MKNILLLLTLPCKRGELAFTIGFKISGSNIQKLSIMKAGTRMIKTSRILLLLLFLSILYCTNDKPLPGGYELLQREYKGEVFIKNITPERTAIYWQTPQVGRSSNLLLGQYKDVKSFVLLRFLVFIPVDTATVQSAILKLNQNYHYGEGDSFRVNIYSVQASWDENEVKWADIENGYDTSQSLASFYVYAVDSAVVEAEIPPDLVNTWISQGDNNGIILTFEDASFMVNFASSDEYVNSGTMDLIYKPKDGGLDTTSINVIHDSSLPQFRGDIEPNVLVNNPERLRVGNLTGYRALLKFDLSEIPVEATIHQAYLTFHVDQELSETGPFGMKMAVTPLVEDSTWNPETLQLDNEYTDPEAIALSSKETLEFSSLTTLQNMTRMVQRWVSGTKPNYGLQFRSTQFGYDISEMYFYSGTPDSALAPVLRITYSKPPTSKFDLP